MRINLLFLVVGLFLFISSCQEEPLLPSVVPNEDPPIGEGGDFSLEHIFDGRIDLDNLPNYASQDVPDYIPFDNTRNNTISDAGAILGRVLFYDTKLSSTNTVSCASCHQQEAAFGDVRIQSEGANGLTGRHSMRLVNARFSQESRFFWDERASTLEIQTTMPIQDHAEMGFSGQNGDPDLDDLIDKLDQYEYYHELFIEAFGSQEITENRMQLALAQFIRSIQSFDSKYDEGRVQVNNPNAPFPNFTNLENLGKQLFNTNGPNGASCARCHRPEAFSIDPNTRNNGVIGVIGSNSVDLMITKSPTLRDMINHDGIVNGPFMHNGVFATLEEVIEHYNDINFDPQTNPQLDPRLRGGGPGGGNGQNLNLTQNEKEALVAFLKTLSGRNVYLDEKWSDPFISG